MFFNLFGKKESKSPEKLFIDISFISQQAKEKGVLKYAKEKTDTIFIAWFADTAENFKKLFTAAGEDEMKIIDAKHFSLAKFPAKEIVFLEHYPLREKEEILVQNCVQEGFRVFNSMTEPFFEYFGGERIAGLMTKMGSDENEEFIHPMINASVKKAQRKLAKNISIEQAASSQKEWMRVNGQF